MLVVVRMEQGKTGSYRTPRELEQLPRTLFGNNVLEDFRASAWPGTELIGHPAHVFLISFDKQVAELVLRTQPDLRKWLHVSNPSLPEDICLFNSNAGTPALVTVSHEHLCWIIDDQKPKLAGVRDTTVRVDELFWKGKHFCREWTRGKK